MGVGARWNTYNWGCVRDSVLSRDLYERYMKICGRLDADSVSERRVRDHLSDMNILGVKHEI